MIVCHCAVVSDRDIGTCLDAGARTVGQVCRATAAGRGCGGCVGTLRALVCQHRLLTETSPTPEVADATA